MRLRYSCIRPVENVWEYLRQNYLGNRVFDTDAAIAGACCEAGNALIADADRIRSIAAREWAVNPRGRWYQSAPASSLRFAADPGFATLLDRGVADFAGLRAPI